MKTIPFTKVVGTGNDFVLVDARKGQTLRGLTLSSLARIWCNRKNGVGADGLLVVLSSHRGDARMRMVNPDGSEAAMCGNGLRCVAWYLFTKRGLTPFHKGSDPKRLTIETQAGLMQAQIVGKERVRIYLQPPHSFRMNIPLTIQGKKRTVHSVNTGVPHTILLLSKLDGVDLDTFGPAVRNHKTFHPQGTNMDLVQIDSPHRIAVRTYERGVEAETLACGTGAAASAVVSAALGKVQSPVSVLTASGELLTIGFKKMKDHWQNLTLEGPAKILFQGEIQI